MVYSDKPNSFVLPITMQSPQMPGVEKISRQRMKIAIVGGGLSLHDVDLVSIKPAHDLTIAINKTALLMPCDVGFSLSLRFSQKINFGNGKPFRWVFAVRKKWEGLYPCETVICVEGGPLTPGRAMLSARHDGAKFGLSETQGIVHGGNSLYAALNWAYLMRPQVINIYGLDGTSMVRYKGVGGSLDHLPALFASAVPQLQAAGIKVVNHSPGSLVDCFDHPV
jgi:hypothetical protein